MHPSSVERLPFTLTESSVLAVIPARFHATRLPGKILADIAGRSMIEHVYRRASAASSVHAVIVATDDERIASVARKFSRVEMTRADHPSGTDRIAEVVARLDCDAAVNIQGDEPLIDPAVIDAVAAALAVFGGFMDVRSDRVTVLTDAAESAEEIDDQRAHAAREAAQKAVELAAGSANATQEALAKASLLRALVRIRVSERRRRTR